MPTLLKNVFDYIFKKRTIVFLGRTGLNWYFNGEKYFVDSEMLVGSPSDIVIYSNRFNLISGGKKNTTDETTRANVLAFLKMELEKQHIKYEIS